MARITKDDIRRILRLMNEATQRIDAEIKAERQAKPVRVNYGGSLVCSIEGYSPMAELRQGELPGVVSGDEDVGRGV